MELFRQYESALAAAQLVLAMLGMGATLRFGDFGGVVGNRTPILLVLMLQFLVAPLLAAAAATWLPLPPGIAFGIVLLAVMPSGALSNLFTHLGGGNMALSITATIGSTLVCLVATPWLLKLLAGWAVEGGIDMPVSSMIQDVSVYLLIPMLVGMAIRHWWAHRAASFSNAMVRLSMVVLVVIVVGSLRSGRIAVWEHGWTVPVVLVAFAVIQYTLTQIVARLARLCDRDSYTLAIEVSIRNGNLAILLSGTLFAGASASTGPISAGALYVALFYGGAALVLAFLGIWTKLLRRRLESRFFRSSRID